MRKLVYLCVSVVFLSACSSVSNNKRENNKQFYRFAGQNGKSWEISADYNRTTNNLLLLINDREIINETTNFVDTVSEFRGIYFDRDINMRCISAFDTAGAGGMIFSPLTSNVTREVCDVFIDGERAALFTFE